MKTKQSERITYKERMTGQDLSKYAKAICFPLVAFAADIWTISSFRAFGTELIAPLSAGIWVSGLITGIILPSHRRTTLNETVIALVGYSVLLMGLISGVSTEMLIASYGQLVSLTGGSAVQGYIQNILWISAIMVPLGFIAMQAKKLVQFKRLSAKNKALDRIRSIRENTK